MGRFTVIALIIGALLLLSVPTLLMWFVLGSRPLGPHSVTKEECHSLIEEISKPTSERQPAPTIAAVQECLAKGLH